MKEDTIKKSDKALNPAILVRQWTCRCIF